MAVQADITLIYPVVGYLLIMGGIGAWAYNKAETADDFLLAGRSLGTAIVAGTLLATWMGSGSITGGGNSIAYSFGLWPAVLLGTAALGGILVLRLLAPRIRGYNKYTIPEILEEGLGKEAKAIGLVVIAVAYVGIVSYQFIGLGFVLNVTTGISVETGTLIAAVMIIGLAMLGGLLSVAYTDALSAFLMVIGLLIGLPFILASAGGWETITASVPQESLEPLGSLSALQFLGYWAPVVLLILADQNMYQRIVAGKSDEGTNRGMIWWFAGVALASVVIPVIAFAARSMFPNIDPGMAMISMTTVIPPWIGGILLAAATAFIITTGNSYLLSASTNVSQDLYRGFINPDASDQRVFWLTRVAVVVLGAFAFILGQYFPTILSIQILAYTAYGATITPALFAIFLMRDQVTRIGGIAGMAVGFGVTIAWDTVLQQPFDLNAVIVSAPLAALVIVGVSLLTSTEKSKANVTDIK
ncbi:sodium:solute symporter family protein [Halegenticoccus tardaugens]|uniref:sodium:solute symporter family protein n=1 Tax=Halegenticoccus tardaugens TaxID=2071624 RepID=UPI00100A8304|nr:sodium:solute symporter family protein [Halegenticoccus tardaugens]